MNALPSTLTDADVAEMRRLHTECGIGYRMLGKRFGVNENVARNIVLGRFRNADGKYPMRPWSVTSKHFGEGPR